MKKLFMKICDYEESSGSLIVRFASDETKRENADRDNAHTVVELLAAHGPAAEPAAEPETPPEGETPPEEEA